MTSPVGEGVATSAAAHRAGLARPRQLREHAVTAPFEGIVDESQLEAFVVGHRAFPLSEGFVGAGLWIRLAAAALRDLVAEGVLPPPTEHFWQRTALHVVVPDASRFSCPPDDVAELIEKLFVLPLADLASLAAHTERQRISLAHAGAAGAAMAARDLIESGAFERVVVLSADSYVDPAVMATIIEEGRLKGPDVQTGLQPGEAAAAILLERPEVAAQRGAEVGAKVLAARHASPASPPPEPTEEDDSGPTAGDRAAYFMRAGVLIAKVISETLADAGIARFAGDIVLDLNGEEWRAAAWGTAQTRPRPAHTRLQQVIDFDASKLILPCASFGEIGAASGVAGVCLAARSFARDYATGDATLVVSLSENGEVGVIVVGRS